MFTPDSFTHDSFTLDSFTCDATPRLREGGGATALLDPVHQLSDRLQNLRIVQLTKEVDDDISALLCARLILLAEEDPRRDIVFLINSPGGSISAGLAIFDTMRAVPCDVATVAMGMALSMGQFLLAAGAKGKRYALPHSRILMHEGSAGVGGSAIDVEIQADNLRWTRDLMFQLNAEFTGQPLERIAADSDRDRWFTAEQARDYGFVDRVVDSLADVRPGRGGRAGY